MSGKKALDKFTVVELKAQLKERNLSTNVSKPDICFMIDSADATRWNVGTESRARREVIGGDCIGPAGSCSKCDGSRRPYRGQI